MTKTKLGFLLGMGCVLGSAMCQYEPHPKSGEMLCGTGDKRCPSGYTCRPQDNLCYLPKDLPVTPATGGTTAAGGGITAAVSSPPATGGQGGGQTTTNSTTPPAGGSSTASASSAGGGSTTLPPVGGSTIIPVGGNTAIPLGGNTIIPLGGRSLITPVGGDGSSGGKIVIGGAIVGGLSSPVAGAGAAGGAGGGSTSSIGKPSGTKVTFSSGKAAGAMTGYAWVTFGPDATVTDPKCGTDKLTASCASITWSTKDSLCMTASIPALPDAPTTDDYNNNWGAEIGINSSYPDGTLGQSFVSIELDISGSPMSGMRAKVHRKGDPETTSFCAEYTTTTRSIPLTNFTRTCYDKTSPGTAIVAADVPNIDKIFLQVYSSDRAIEVKNFCIAGITFYR